MKNFTATEQQVIWRISIDITANYAACIFTEETNDNMLIIISLFSKDSCSILSYNIYTNSPYNLLFSSSKVLHLVVLSVHHTLTLMIFSVNSLLRDYFAVSLPACNLFILIALVIILTTFFIGKSL